MLHAAVDCYLGECGDKAIAQTVAQASQTATLFRHFLLRDFTGLTKSNDTGNVQRAGTQSALMAASINHRDKPHGSVMAHVEGTAALGTIKLVGCERSQIKLGAIDVERDFTQCLHGVRVKKHAALAAEFSNLLNGLEHASFVVGGHDADQYCAICKAVF